jgi:NADPH2:quinone reductase
MFAGRAWRVVTFGDPNEAVELQEMTWGEPSPGQVLIRTRTAGAGLPDVMMTAGHFPLLGEPPFGLGEEAAGEVVAVPPGSRFAIGDCRRQLNTDQRAARRLLVNVATQGASGTLSVR